MRISDWSSDVCSSDLACAASGTTTLLVPVLGGVIEGELGLDGTSIRNLLLDSLGPVFIVCGVLPASPGTRCQLDDQIAGLLPAEVTSLGLPPTIVGGVRSEEHTSELQSLMRISYAVFCLKKKTTNHN